MKTGDKKVIADLISRGFDINARDYVNGATPLFYLQDRFIFNEFMYKGEFRNMYDKNGRLLRNLFAPARDVPQIHVQTIRVAIVGDTKYSAKCKYTNAEAFVLGATLANQKSPQPKNCKDPLRPGRFEWSSKRLTGAIATAVTDYKTELNNSDKKTDKTNKSSTVKDDNKLSPKYMPIIWYETLPGNDSSKLCVQIGDYRWFKERNEPADCIIFMYSIDNPSSLYKLANHTVPKLLRGYRNMPDNYVDSGDEEGNGVDDNKKGGWAQSVWNATRVMVGIGRETCGETSAIAFHKMYHGQIRTEEQCQQIAEYCQMHGYIETEKTPEGFNSLLLEAIKVHIKSGVQENMAVKESEANAITLGDKTTLLGFPYPQETKVKQAKMLILGHLGSGKSSLMTHLVKEDINASKHYTFSALKSRVGYGTDDDADKKDPASFVHKAVSLNNLVSDCTLRVIDFAGQIECISSYEMFFSQFNTLYVITVNGATNTIAQLRHWLEVLEQSKRGPYIDSALLVVCTMSDLILNGCNGVTVKEVEITHEIQAWNLSKRMDVRVLMASNKTGDGLKTVINTISTYAKKIASRRVPKVFYDAQKSIERIPGEAISLFCTPSQLPTVIILISYLLLFKFYFIVY